ncbi:MAG: adenylosuccinate lyase [Clostridiales bacterium]|nr:adenylosuccinate lyase [Clostridiales bacterium]
MTNLYESPFSLRWASDEMRYLFSQEKKFITWREMWVALAEAEKELGLNISDKQIKELKDNINNLDLERAVYHEKQTRHDVMSHILTYGEQCPEAKPIIHLGATSCFVGDNTDVLIIKESLQLLREKLLKTVENLADFAIEYKDMPTLGFTHFQPAQLVTVGKRATLWLQDLLLDLDELEFVIDNIKLRGAKGTTGTQASYLELFENDHEKTKKLDIIIAEKLGIKSSFDVTGQTYPRKMDSRVLNVLSQIAQSAHKFATDLRLLQNLKEIEEPFGKKQIGSSAMAYKRNPMRSERICGLARFVINNALNGAVTASVQWFERTLDDSSNRRLSISEAFLAVDSILNLYINITEGMVVYPGVIKKRIMEELPFMATETILMNAVKRGGDRQELHEVIRVCSMKAAENVKKYGKENNLIDLIAKENIFGMSLEELNDILDPTNFTGRSSEQTLEFINEVIKPRLSLYESKINKIEINE